MNDALRPERAGPAPTLPSSVLAPLRDRYNQRREAAIAAFRQRPDPDRLLRSLTQAADDCLRHLWRELGLGSTALLAAIGGYGRAELFPHSDVDLQILTEGEPTAELSVAFEQFVGACWDVGLPIGHSVRSLDDAVVAVHKDVTVQTSLLEKRFLAGSRRLYVELSRRLAAEMDPRAFFTAKVLEMRQRHVKYEDTPYSLEPNTKESPGGLRDLHVIAWTARAAGLGAGWSELARQGLIERDEARVIKRNERALKRIRAMLHVVAGRREDRLVFDLQALVAEGLGFSGSSARRTSEELMQRYYWAAKTVTQFNTILLQNTEAALMPRPDAVPEPLDEEFQNRDGLLDAIDPQVFSDHPSSILRAFLRMEQHSELTGMTARTLRAIWRNRERIDGSFRRDPVNRDLFMQILRQPRGVIHELRRMNQWSVLGRYLPVFRRIVGRMQHDLFHVYTVDQHILIVIRNLRRFTLAAHAHEYPFCSQLMAGYDKPWLLYTAALFHDIAKGRGGDHSKLGRIDARRFARDHRLTRDESELLEFLVEHHLTMSSVAQKQDLSSPEVIARFANLVGTEHRLVSLYLLTVADIRGTGPKVWNAWKGKLLEDLFRAAKRALDGEAPAALVKLDAHRREALRVLNLYALSEDAYRKLWSQLDVAYFLRTDANDIAWHTRMLHAHVDTLEPIVRTRLAPIGEGFQVVVYIPDQPELFARLCGYFDRKNLSVMDAQIHTTKHGYALDSFLVVDPTGAGAYRDILLLVESELTQRLSAQEPLAPPVRGRVSRRSRYFPIKPTIDLRPDERGQHYMLSVTANDRMGLLYSIAKVLSEHRVNLYTARVTTLGERVEDLFLVDGPVLNHARGQLQLETDLLATLAN